MCMSAEQKRQKDEARREAIQNTHGIDATGHKGSLREFDHFSNEIDDE
jgi:hypothetical protein